MYLHIIPVSIARERGFAFYFTGKQCSNGHIASRYTKGRGCVICRSESTRKSALRLAERRSERERKRRLNNLDKFAEATRRYRERNPGCGKEANSKWRSENRHRLNANQSKRRAAEIRATVSWANCEAIAAIFAEAKRLTVETGIEHHVDHIVPLSSKLVCGLHWEGNLQVIPAYDNLAKNNRLWPDMP